MIHAMKSGIEGSMFTIHGNSNRKALPFVPVSCNSLAKGIENSQELDRRLIEMLKSVGGGTLRS